MEQKLDVGTGAWLYYIKIGLLYNSFLKQLMKCRVDKMTRRKHLEPPWKKFLNDRLEMSGLYYKHITIVIDAASVVSEWRSKL